MLRALGNLAVIVGIAGACYLGYQMWLETRTAAEMGRGALRSGDYSEAVAWLEAAASEDPDDLSIQLDLGEAYARHGDKPKAAGAYRRAERLLFDPASSISMMEHRQRFTALRSEGY